MGIQLRAAAVLLCAAATSAHADSEGFGRCKSGYSEDTRVRTESRGEMTIADVQVNDRVWSFNESVGRPGWSRVVRRLEAGPLLRLLSHFSEPGSSDVVKACWLIRRRQ